MPTFSEHNTTIVATAPLASDSAYGNPLGGITREIAACEPSIAAADGKTFAAVAHAVPILSNKATVYGKMLGRAHHANANVLTGRKKALAYPCSIAQGAYGPHLAHRAGGSSEAVWTSCYTQGGFDPAAFLPWKIQIVGPRKRELALPDGSSFLQRPARGLDYSWQPEYTSQNQYAGARAPWGSYITAPASLEVHPIRGTYRPHNPDTGEQDDWAPIEVRLERRYSCADSEDYIADQLGITPASNQMPWWPWIGTLNKCFLRNENPTPADFVYASDIWYRDLFWDIYHMDAVDEFPLNNAPQAVMGYGEYFHYDGATTDLTLLGYYEWIRLLTSGQGASTTILEFWGFQTAGSLTKLTHCFPALFVMACPNKLDDVARTDYSVDPQFMRMTYAHYLQQVEYVGDDIIWNGQDIPSLESLDFDHPNYTTKGTERLANALMSTRDEVGEIIHRNRSYPFAVCPLDTAQATDSVDPESPEYNGLAMKYIDVAE